MADPPPTRRHRSSTSRSNALPLDGAGATIVDSLHHISEADPSSEETITSHLDRILTELNQAADLEFLQDHFRRHHGFQALLSSLEKWLADPESRVERVAADVTRVLAILKAAFRQHDGNRRYFSHRVQGGGWDALAAITNDLQLKLRATSGARVLELSASVARSLLALAVENDQTRPNDPDTPNVAQNLIEEMIEVVTPSTKIVLPQALRVLAIVCMHPDEGNVAESELRPAFLQVLTKLSESNIANQSLLAGAGIVDILLDTFILDSTTPAEHDRLQSLLSDLLQFQVGSLATAERLFQLASSDDKVRRILELVMSRQKPSPCIQFDLSRMGHASLEIPCLPRAFPPPTGYTLTSWLRIDEFEPQHHTTIFGAFDATQTCFVLAYIEQASNLLILQTSVTSTSPSVRFKRFRFNQGIWYHIAIVHRPPKTGLFGEAILYVNGRRIERRDGCLYPLAAPLQDSTTALGPFSPDANVRRPVQAFFGTPRDLAAAAGSEHVKTKWSLATAHLYDLCLSRELVAVQHSLGPGYAGNFQDRVGSFLTYDASATLNRYNEELHGDRAEASGIVSTAQSRGSDALHEGSNLLSLFATSSVSPDDDAPLEEATPLVAVLPEKAAKQLQQLKRTGNTIVFNANRPFLSDALARPYGVAVLTGTASLCVPHTLDDAAWQISGFSAVHSMLLSSASTTEQLRSSVQFLCQSVKYNFRACDAMERDDGYSIIALLLREKLGLTSASSAKRSSTAVVFSTPEERDQVMVGILETLLRFVGIDIAHPEKAMITNPMAYRKLLTDLDTWRTGSVKSQRLFYQQFCHLLDPTNTNRPFNAKRLSQMRIVRRFMDCLRSDIIYKANVEYVLDALDLLYEHAASKHDHKDVITFVSFCLQEGKVNPTTTQTARSKSISIALRDERPRTPTGSTFNIPLRTASGSSSNAVASNLELGIDVFQAYACLMCDSANVSLLRRFQRSIPGSWLLHLLDDTPPAIAGAAFQLICRCVVIIGGEYTTKLTKSTGVSIIRARIRPYWQQPVFWWSSFAALFGVDVPVSQYDMPLSGEGLRAVFPPSRVSIRNEECMQWLLGLMDAGLNGVTHSEDASKIAASKASASIVQAALMYLAELYRENKAVKEFFGSPGCLKDMLRVAYPSIADTRIMKAADELENYDAPDDTTKDVLLRPHASSISGGRPTIIRSGSSATTTSKVVTKLRTPRRPSSFVLVDAADSSEVRLSAYFNPVMTPSKGKLPDTPIIDSSADLLLDVSVMNLIDQACLRKDFSGFGLFLRVPPGDKIHQAYFSSYVLLRTMSALWTHLMANEALLRSPRTLTNLAKCSLHMAEAVFEGWFMDGAQPLVDFTGKLLDYVQRPDIASLKNVRLCSQAISTVRTVFLRIVLLRLSELDATEAEGETLRFLKQLTYWQTILFAPENQETPFIRLLCYVLYTKLVSNSPAVRSASAALFRMLLVLKPTEAATILVHDTDGPQRHLSTGFMKLATHDDEEMLQWIDQRREPLDKFFLDALSVHWEEFVDSENKKTEESARNRISKRREELKKWDQEEQSLARDLHQFQQLTAHWRISSHTHDNMRLHRTLQDQQEDIHAFQAALARQNELMEQPCGLRPDRKPAKWLLDRTESRDRMRVRLLRDKDGDTKEYQPKRKLSERVLAAWERDRVAARSGSPASRTSSLSKQDVPSVTPSQTTPNAVVDAEALLTAEPDEVSAQSLLEDDFELIEDPRDEQELYEDKNRKILRSVKRGDSIKAVYNVSRIVGLEACEGLLIIGRTHLYMRDHMFQRRDKEIVGINSAPPEERDIYVQMISGREVRTSRTVRTSAAEELARSWAWKDVISMSKRRFLFRSVAIEVFFNDGRSYLLVFASPQIRDAVYSDSARQAPHITGPTSSMSEEDQWRLDSLRGPDDMPQTLGNKFASVFNSSTSNSATRKWMRGEISNFNYLMLVNTMAGRTFNDLTQYPVFPWVLADYSSDELDLDDPRTFRDLSKPMGCQTHAREAEFRERYQTFAEMGDERPFHYGTHYSSAMIVTSYLIRLQPFVQSYLLLQGGTFDHADRLFDSIEKAWVGSSKQNMTDVRELTPEFYCLPEFLTNINEYDFGVKEGSGQAIGDVHLPKWAKGDPHLFIKKHREALESPYVSEHLHEWLDLIFGYKQKGEAAVEATNIFHPLSYHGAKDLDSIDDPVERLATIGIIHNFGQTPQQVFYRPHPRREQEKHTQQRLDTQADTLARLPRPVAEISERVGSILHLPTTNKVLASGSCKLFSPPDGSFFAQWQYADNSLRFFDTESRKLLGLFEELHIGPLSAGLFIDSKTFLTGGADSTIGVWDIIHSPSSSGHLDLRPKQHLFGHRRPITHLAVSRIFSTILSASADGQVIMWDLNRYDCIRVLQPPNPTRPIDALRMSNLTGNVLIASGPTLRLLTINGHVLLEQRLGDDAGDRILGGAFYDGHGAEWVPIALLFTGHRGAVLRVWQLVALPDGSWHLQLVRQLCHAVDEARPAGVSAIAPHESGVFVGDEAGVVVSYVIR